MWKCSTSQSCVRIELVNYGRPNSGAKRYKLAKLGISVCINKNVPWKNAPYVKYRVWNQFAAHLRKTPRLSLNKWMVWFGDKYPEIVLLIWVIIYINYFNVCLQYVCAMQRKILPVIHGNYMSVGSQRTWILALQWGVPPQQPGYILDTHAEWDKFSFKYK